MHMLHVAERDSIVPNFVVAAAATVVASRTAARLLEVPELNQYV